MKKNIYNFIVEKQRVRKYHVLYTKEPQSDQKIFIISADKYRD